MTHAHHDHPGDAIDISTGRGAPLLTTPEAASHCDDNGSTTIAAHMGGIIDRGFCEVKLLPVWHSPSIDGRTIHHAGDTALFREEFDLDMAMLSIGGWYTMGVEKALRSLPPLGPKTGGADAQ